MPASHLQDDCGGVAPHLLRKFRKRRIHFQSGGTRGEPKPVHGPQHRERNRRNGRKGCDEAQRLLRKIRSEFSRGEIVPVHKFGGCEEEQHRKKENSRVLCGQTKARGEPRSNETDRGGLFQIEVEAANAQENSERRGDVGRDQRAVSKKIGLENKQRQCHECRPLAPHGIRQEKHGESQEEGEGGRSHSRSPQNGTGVVAVKKIAAGPVFHHFEIGVRDGRRSQGQAQERKRGDEFYERGMFGIGSKIEVLPVPVACENMDAFVKSLGLLPRRQGQFRRHGKEEQRDSHHEPCAMR